MNRNLAQAMGQALGQTRASNLFAATQTIQAALAGSPINSVPNDVPEAAVQ